MEIPLRSEILHLMENDQAEDERLIRLASSDQEAFGFAMHVKKTQIAVRDAETVLR